MAKLKAYGRTELARVSKRKDYPGPYHPATYSEDYKTELVKANEVQWEIFTETLMSDGKVLAKEKWKSHNWDKPFEKGWYVKATVKAGVTAAQWLEFKAKFGWIKE